MKFLILISALTIDENALSTEEFYQSFLRQESFGIRFGYWYNKLAGEAKSSTTLIPGTTLDFDSELGIDKPDSPALHITGWLDFPFVGRINLGFWRSGYDSQHTLTTQESFAGETYPSSTTVNSKQLIDMYNFTLETPFLIPGIQFLAGSEFLSSETKITSTTASVSQKIWVPIPVTGIRFGGWLSNNLSVDGMLLINGLSSLGNTKGRFIDMKGEVGIRPYGSWTIMAGYRVIDLFGKEKGSDETFLDVKVKGFFFGIGISF